MIITHFKNLCIEIFYITKKIFGIYFKKGELMKSVFEGCGVALITPFKKNKVDFESLEKIINRDIENGAKAIVILATTGEGVSVSDGERKEIIKFCRKLTDGKTKLVVGTGNNNFEKCKENTLLAKDLDADAVLVVTPYYNKTSQTGIVKYYQNLSNFEIPMIMYNVPARTGLMIETETIRKIIETNPYVYGLKESTTDIARIIRLSRICNDKISLYSGEDELNFLFYCLGAQGTISVTANILTKEVQEIYQLVSQNKIQKALQLQQKISEINEILFCETNPVPIKFFMSLAKLCKKEIRLPLVDLCNQNKNKIRKIYESCKKDGLL